MLLKTIVFKFKTCPLLQKKRAVRQMTAQKTGMYSSYKVQNSIVIAGSILDESDIVTFQQDTAWSKNEKVKQPGFAWLC